MVWSTVVCSSLCFNDCGFSEKGVCVHRQPGLHDLCVNELWGTNILVNPRFVCQMFVCTVQEGLVCMHCSGMRTFVWRCAYILFFCFFFNQIVFWCQFWFLCTCTLLVRILHTVSNEASDDMLCLCPPSCPTSWSTSLITTRTWHAFWNDTWWVSCLFLTGSLCLVLMWACSLTSCTRAPHYILQFTHTRFKLSPAAWYDVSSIWCSSRRWGFVRECIEVSLR